MSKLSLFHLSIKTSFLLTMATARHVSEIHAFAIDEECFRFSSIDGSLTLRTQVGLLVKNQLLIKLLSLLQFQGFQISVRVTTLTAFFVQLELSKSISKGQNL